MLKFIVILLLITMWAAKIQFLLDAEPTTKTTTTATTTPAPLPETWTAKFNGQEYLFVNELKNWFGALHYCKEHNMSLASSESAEENDFLILQIQNRNSTLYYWLGGNNLETRNVTDMYWVNTGEKMNYTDWAPNQPDNLNDQESCVHMFHFDVPSGELSTGWNDKDCYEQLPFICKEKPQKENGTSEA